MGLLKALLGKPGTLHSPGHIFPSTLGVPPDLRDASDFLKLVEDLGRGGCGCIPADPAGRVCLSYQAGVGPSHNDDVDRLETRVPRYSSHII